MTDSKILSILRGYEHWVGKDPWKGMADRFEELMKIDRALTDIRNKKEESNESANRSVSKEPS
jgi:hypothetical protein